MLQNVITQIRRIPENLPERKIWFCTGNTLIQIERPNQNYKPMEVDIISRLFEGLSVRVKTGIKGQPILNLGREY